jgi:uncharacterized protein (DUF1778 family)
VLTLRAAAVQPVLRTGFVTVRAGCDEACSVVARGTVVVGRRGARAAAAPRIVTPLVRRVIAAGRTATLRLRLARRDRARIRRALRRPGRTATVRVVVTANDAARNLRSRTVHVRIRR